MLDKDYVADMEFPKFFCPMSAYTIAKNSVNKEALVRLFSMAEKEEAFVQHIIDRADFDLTMELFNHDPSIVNKTPLINELYPLVESVVSHSDIAQHNSFLGDEIIRDMVDEGITSFSMENYTIPEDVSEFIMSKGETSNGFIPQKLWKYLYQYDISLNPNLPQSMYMRLIDGGVYLESLCMNDGLDADTLIALHETAPQDNNTVLSSALRHKNMPQEYIDSCPESIVTASVCSTDRAEDFLESGMFITALTLNDNLTDDQKKRLIKQLTPSHYFSASIFNDIDDVDIFQECIDKGLTTSSNYLIRVRDEVELLSSSESSAQWAIRNSPHKDVVLECTKKYPQLSKHLTHNPFIEE